MSKLYEALLRARAEQDLESRFERGATLAIRKPEIVKGALPPLQMEKEMGRLFLSVAGLLPNPQRGIIQFIGSQKDAGTSTILREFGVFLTSKAGKSVLLVDADWTHLPQHLAVGVSARMSIQWIMNEGGSVDEAIAPVKNSRLFLCRLYEGPDGNARAEFMLKHREVWNKLRQGFDFILIDSSPMEASDEALTVCSSTDGVILVVEAEKTRSRVVANLLARVSQSDGKVLGLVFNKQRFYIPRWIYNRL